MRERQRESGDEETGKEAEQEEKKKIKKKIAIRRREGDRVCTASRLSPSFSPYCSSLAGLRLPESVLVT